jgi:hypothetical protein
MFRSSDPCGTERNLGRGAPGRLRRSQPSSSWQPGATPARRRELTANRQAQAAVLGEWLSARRPSPGWGRRRRQDNVIEAGSTGQRSQEASRYGSQTTNNKGPYRLVATVAPYGSEDSWKLGVVQTLLDVGNHRRALRARERWRGKNCTR